MSLHLITGYAGEEHITSADQGSFNAAIMGEGQFVMERGNQFAASIISNNKVRILDGDLLMKGRHFRLNEDTYEELNFENGTQGYQRNDLIVARYTKDATTGIESASLVVIKGTPSETSPVDPEYTDGDIIHEHALLNDMTLYRVPFDGLNIQTLVCLFDTVPTLETVVEEVRGKTEEAIEDMRESTVNNLATAIATTEDNIPVSTKVAKELDTNLTNIINKIYPVGSIYMSVNNVSPATFIGGTWSALTNRFLIGAGGTYAVNATGGETTHVLTTTEMPVHNHSISANKSAPQIYSTTPYSTTSGLDGAEATAATVSWQVSGTTAQRATTGNGSGGAHNNMPPYLGVYMWKRTA
ncbi:MAG: hypothetical protein ACERKZ_02480 [Lachnotalea sp.]